MAFILGDVSEKKQRLPEGTNQQNKKKVFNICNQHIDSIGGGINKKCKMYSID